MAGCCGGDDEAEKQEGMVVKRGCRDILCLLLFLAFWAGMFIICGLAFRDGQPNRLVYGVDSFGFTCGTKNTIFNKTFDLTDAKNLYFLNPLDLLEAGNINYAKTVCSDGCPGAASLCSKDKFPCTTNAQYVCPYYRFAEDNIYDLIGGMNETDITYWSDLERLTSLPNGTSASAAAFLTKAKSVGGYFATVATSLESNLTGKYFQLQSQFPGNGPCYPVLVETYRFFYRCFPKFEGNVTAGLIKAAGGVSELTNSTAVKEFAKKWQTESQKWGRYVGDISRGILIIVIGGLVCSVVSSLIWLLILRFLGGVMVWIAMIIVNLMMVAATLYAWAMAGYIGSTQVGKDVLDALPVEINPVQDEKKTWFWIAIGMSITAGVLLLVTILCITRIKIAIACMKVASQAVSSMPTLIFFPFLPFIFEVGLVIYWIAVTAMLYSAGTLTANCREAKTVSFAYQDYANISNLNATSYNPLAADPTVTKCYQNVTSDQRSYSCGQDPNCYLTYDWNNDLKYAFIYHFFGLLWTNQVIVGFTCVTIAGAIGHFYWAGGDSAKMPTFPILSALKNTVIFHMGSVCFGAIIIAIVQFIRFLLEYLDRKTKELQEANAAAAWLMCCVKCCMWCLEKIVKFINRNAYILVAIKGEGYCCAAINAVKLIVTNALRMAVVNLVADIMIFLGKVCVAVTCGLVAFAMTEADYYNNPTKYPDTYLYSPVLPIALSIITGYVVAEIFFAVYEMAIDTILLAFCEDCDKNGEPKYAPPLLMEAMNQVPKPAAKADGH